MAVEIPVLREVVERVCTRQDVLAACKRDDLGAVIKVLVGLVVVDRVFAMAAPRPDSATSR